jgi:hypothetical protein
VSSSVCVAPRSVGYMCKSSVCTGQAGALSSSPAFTSNCVRKDWFRSPGNVMTADVVSGSDISRRFCVESSLIVDD